MIMETPDRELAPCPAVKPAKIIIDVDLAVAVMVKDQG